MKIFIEYEELDKRVELLIPGHYKLKKIKVGQCFTGGHHWTPDGKWDVGQDGFYISSKKII